MLRRFFVPTLSRSGPIELPAEEARHAAQVLRVAAGDRVELFNGRGQSATAEIESVSKRSVMAIAGPVEAVNRESPHPITLAVALPKGDRGRLMVEKAVELGASRLVPLRCQRSVVEPRGKSLERLRRTVIEASKQCGRNELMEIASPVALSELAQQSPETTLRLLAHPGGTLSPTSIQPVGPATIAVGPEGGFTEDEVAQALAAGWASVSLGPRILRIETAALALLAIAIAGSDG